MRLTRYGRVAAVVMTGTLALAACGSDDNADTDTADPGTQPSADGSSAATDEAECGTGELNGEGSSAQKNAIDEAIVAYIEQCSDATINYNATGSGAGIKQFNASQVDFAGSDSALKEDEVTAAKERCAGNDAWNIPMVAGPIAMAYNLEGVDTLILDGPTAAGIYLGTIKTWNDPKIAALNPDATLPDSAITVFGRSDESGTTENFEKYLAAAAPDVWTAEPSKQWAGAGEGKEKSAGVSEGVKSTAGSITYVEWSYARDNNLGIAQLDSGAGPVELTGESAGKAIAVAEAAGEGNDLRLKLDYATKEADTYPVVLVTYEIVCSAGLGAEKTADLKAFLSYFSSAEAQGALEEIGYAPLPAEVQTKVATAVEAIAP